ncbi:MAG: DUF4190 domain-containing protein [Candidatus Nomurabacteria bacterium]|jgi:ABC-type antimicrobial peptide transport system permease subunit|nr:DUF4190 domain-containing protein [Candidatus Nomurabacteria bacterium]
MAEQDIAKTTNTKPEVTNGLAIAGFICSFFVSVLGIILGAVALGQIKKTGEGGKGLATAGIVIGAVSMVISIIAIVFFVIISVSTTGTVIDYYDNMMTDMMTEFRDNYNDARNDSYDDNDRYNDEYNDFYDRVLEQYNDSGSYNYDYN